MRGVRPERAIEKGGVREDLALGFRVRRLIESN